MIRRKLLNFGAVSTDCRLGFGAFSELSRFFASAVGRPCRALLVLEGSVPDTAVVSVRRSLIDAGYEVHEVLLDDSATLGIADTSKVYAALDEGHITGEDLVVGLGGMRVCSAATFCANTWCEGTAAALVPTTLDAMMCSSTQMTPLATETGFASVSLPPHPALVVCDLDLVRDAGIAANGMGYVLLCAAELAESRKCWEDFEGLSERVASGDDQALLEALSSALTSRLNTVKSASPSARKAFMFGETTARALASCLGASDAPAYLLRAEGMRFEARLAVDACDFSVDEMFALDDRFEDLGVGELTFDIDPEVFIEALRAQRFRRSNRFQLALPKYPGVMRLATVEDAVLERHARAFLASRRS